MTYLSRREFLEAMAAASAAAAMGCHRQADPFARERVCIHVLQPRGSIPPPLLQATTAQPRRSAGGEYFNAGLPELAICTTRARLLDSFPYFWPFSCEDLETLRKGIEIRYQKPTIASELDTREFVDHLRRLAPDWKQNRIRSAVIFTWNTFTQQWCKQVAEACRVSEVDEFVVLKDPTIPPYLCDYPAKQRGFKRSPP